MTSVEVQHLSMRCTYRNQQTAIRYKDNSIQMQHEKKLRTTWSFETRFTALTHAQLDSKQKINQSEKKN